MKETIEQKKDRLSYLISQCKTAKGDSVPKGYTYKDISKTVCEIYATQPVEVIKIYFKSDGRATNNIPYKYQDEQPLGTYGKITQWLYDVRTAQVNDLFKQPLEQTEDIEEVLTEEQEKLLGFLYS